MLKNSWKIKQSNVTSSFPVTPRALSVIFSCVPSNPQNEDRTNVFLLTDTKEA